MKSRIFILLNLMTLLVCCTNKKAPEDDNPIVAKPYPHNIDINEGLKSSTELKLSSIADSIKYIVLSKEKEILIKSFPDLQMTDSEFFINSQGHFYRFDLSGKYLNTIGSSGRGPEEYLPGSTFSVSPSSDIIYVRRNFALDYISFNSAGDFLGKVSLKNMDNIWEFVCLSDSKFMYTLFYIFMKGKSLEDKILCGLFDKNGNKIQVIEHPAIKIAPTKIDYSRFSAMPPPFSFFNNEVVMDNLQDTIYKITNDSIYHGFIFSWGNIRHRQKFEEFYYKQDVNTEPIKNASRCRHFLETSGNAYFCIWNLDKNYLFEYDKYTGLTKSMLTDKNSFGFINDLDGGANYYPKWTNRAGDIWIVYDDAFDFKKMHNEALLSKSNAVYPYRKEDLRQFLNTLNIDDNPVLKVVYLKKQPNYMKIN